VFADFALFDAKAGALTLCFGKPGRQHAASEVPVPHLARGQVTVEVTT